MKTLLNHSVDVTAATAAILGSCYANFAGRLFQICSKSGSVSKRRFCGDFQHRISRRPNNPSRHTNSNLKTLNGWDHWIASTTVFTRKIQKMATETFFVCTLVLELDSHCGRQLLCLLMNLGVDI